MLARAITAINFFILVLSNVASKLLWATIRLNKAKTSKNSELHPVRLLSLSLLLVILILIPNLLSRSTSAELQPHIKPDKHRF
jgi:hypothetical protein